MYLFCKVIYKRCKDQIADLKNLIFFLGKPIEPTLWLEQRVTYPLARNQSKSDSHKIGISFEKILKGGIGI